MTIETICWRRIDTPGHDACRLEQHEDRWLFDGAAVFSLHGEPVHLAYRLMCDRSWRTREGIVTGWVGRRDCELKITRSDDGRWTLNGEIRPGLGDCVDLDFGFTPATNLSQLRRLALEIGQAADVPVAWLNISTGALDVLHQRYERRTTDAYWYEARRFDYAVELQVRPSGFVRHYPGLWEEER